MEDWHWASSHIQFPALYKHTEDKENEEWNQQERKMASIPCALIVLLICLSQDHMGELQGINVTLTAIEEKFHASIWSYALLASMLHLILWYKEVN